MSYADIVAIINQYGMREVDQVLQHKLVGT
jgi:hypothetical protein